MIQHLESFLAKAACASDGSGLPRFVQRELRGYLSCGVLARGLVRLHCDHCHRHWQSRRAIPLTRGLLDDVIAELARLSGIEVLSARTALALSSRTLGSA